MIKIICVGKKTEYDGKIKEYLIRLKTIFKTEIIAIDYSHKEYDEARKIESKKILEKIKQNDFVCLLDERGVEIDNYELTKKIINNPNFIFIIGGPYGVNDELRERANFVLKLSRLILPYEICRLILVEQIYRSQTIHLNQSYHHK